MSPEVCTLKHTTSSEIISCLCHSFSRFSLPRTLISNNSTQFVSHEFEAFLHHFEIHHTKSSNYFPSGNGCVECFYSTLKSRLQRLSYDFTVDLALALDKILFDIWKMPNAMTGETPFKLFFGRDICTELHSHSLADPPNSP